MKKTKRARKARTTSVRKHATSTYSIHKWVIFGVICLAVGFLLASFQSGLAKGKPGIIPTPTPTFCQTHPLDPTCNGGCNGAQCN